MDFFSDKPWLIALDTSGDPSSVGVFFVDGTTIARGRSLSVTGRKNSEQLLLALQQCLAEMHIGLPQVGAIAVGKGPGSFTGIRIGLATAKGLAYGLGVPLIAVSSHETLGYSMHNRQMPIVVVTDAKRAEVFVSCYRLENGELHTQVPTSVFPPEDLAAWLKTNIGDNRNICFVGDGLSAFGLQTQIATDYGSDSTIEAYPTAENVASYVVTRMNRGITPPQNDDSAPIYIRLSEAEQKFPQGNPGGAFAPTTIVDSALNTGSSVKQGNE